MEQVPGPCARTGAVFLIVEQDVQPGNRSSRIVGERVSNRFRASKRAGVQEA